MILFRRDILCSGESVINGDMSIKFDGNLMKLSIQISLLTILSQSTKFLILYCRLDWYYFLDENTQTYFSFLLTDALNANCKSDSGKVLLLPTMLFDSLSKLPSTDCQCQSIQRQEAWFKLSTCGIVSKWVGGMEAICLFWLWVMIIILVW